MKKNKRLREDTWEEFKETGLLLFINQILHLFGWTIAMNINNNGVITHVYPARTSFRGFSNDSVLRSYCKITKYLKENIDEIHKENINEITN